MSLTLDSPKEVSILIAVRIRQERLTRGWTQKELSARAGLELPTYRVFERTGHITLERLLALASALGRLGEWDMLLRPRPAQSLKDLSADRPARQRGVRARRDSTS